MGVTITVTCRIVYHKGTAQEQLVYEGTSEPITISEITNSASIKMTQKFDGLGQFTSTIFHELEPSYATIIEYAIPYGYTGIGNNAFQNCTALTRLTIPATVTTIGNSICDGCTALTTVIMEPESPPTLSASPFPATTIIYVPSGSVNAYKTRWSSRSDYIRAMP